VSDTQRRVRPREGRWAGLCRGLAVLLRLGSVLCRGLAEGLRLLARGLDSSARVLLETVAEEQI
jgi:hypothetical protein